MEYSLFLVIVAPAMASVVWVLSRAWSLAVFGGNTISERVRRWQRLGFWLVLAAGYLMGIIIGVAQHKF
jgi:hypothetical protein